MTTICYRDGVLAADSMVQSGSANIGNCKKIFHVGHALVAGSGDYQDLLAFVAWLKSNDQENKPKLDDGFDAILVNQRGEVFGYNHSLVAFEIEYHGGYFALGSGSEFALGAMAAGASAEAACAIACRYDINSAGPVVVERV